MRFFVGDPKERQAHIAPGNNLPFSSSLYSRLEVKKKSKITCGFRSSEGFSTRSNKIFKILKI